MGILGGSATSMRAVCLEAELLQHAKSLVAGKLLGGSDAEAGRALSEGKISLAKGVFGDSSTIHGPPARRGDYVPWRAKDYVMAPNGPHLLRRGVARRGGLEPGGLQRRGLHEMTHVWHQHGVNVLLVGAYQQARQFLLGDQYALPVGTGKDVKDYNIEQQGDIVRDYFLEKNEFGKPLRTSFAGVLKNFPTGY